MEQVEKTKAEDVEVVGEEKAVEAAVEEPKEKTIWDLDLHETLNTDMYSITRTPSGWAYYVRIKGAPSRAAFHVPFTAEGDMK